MKKRLVTMILIMLAITGCGKKEVNTEYDKDKLDYIDNVEDATDQISDNNAKVKLTDDDYIKGFKWIMNPSAGKVYWESTYGEYSSIVSDDLLKLREQEVDGKVIIDDDSEDEIQYTMKNVYKYPEYIKNEDGILTPETTNTYEEKGTIEYSEYNTYLKTLGSDTQIVIPSYTICQDREYIVFDVRDFYFGDEAADKFMEALKNTFYNPEWNLKVVDRDEETVVLKDIGKFWQGGIGGWNETYIGETIYTLNLDETGKIRTIDVSSSLDRQDKTYGYGNSNRFSREPSADELANGNDSSDSNTIDSNESTSEVTDNTNQNGNGNNGLDGNNNETVDNNSNTDNNIVTTDDDPFKSYKEYVKNSTFDEEYKKEFGEYPDDSKITNRVLANTEISNKYHVDDMKDALLKEASKYCLHPILTAAYDNGNYVYFSMCNAFEEQVYGVQEVSTIGIVLNEKGEYKVVDEMTDMSDPFKD